MPKKLKRVLSFTPVLAMIGIFVPGAGTQTQKAPNAREQPPLIQSVKGSDLFRAYCAPATAWMPKERVQRRPR